MKPLIYIAGPFSTEQERESLKHMIELVKKEYPKHRLYIPMEYKVKGDFQKEDGTWNLPNHEWARQVYEKDYKELYDSNIVVAMYTGRGQSQSGTAWELGYARARYKHTILYIPDWAKNNPMSLMVINSVGLFLMEDGTLVANYEKHLNQK